MTPNAIVAQLVEHRPSKSGVASSNLVYCSIFRLIFSHLTPENGFLDAKIIPGASFMYSVEQKHEQWKKDNGFS